MKRWEIWLVFFLLSTSCTGLDVDIFYPFDIYSQLLHDTFSAFGVISGAPKVMRDPDTGLSKGFGFVSFDDFESSGREKD